ncbi:glycosyltransferase WbuB [Paraburkholderia diazotrophica]|uniref:Colanic acid biosynthesis glycosyl transferase WcaI n=1 Tax=Paraburkholderia diazotrophica TaxID=667676 RepID=A0A1H7D719_9BURK|nr:glycosyltransferase WbuB [Paraburkholderia diazotrophica]SEJ96647.1 colanic acid biosynthesis glycosyl transferase WcaI [Paraburkholderia diazotrophica]
MKILIYGLNYAPELSGTGKYTAEMAQMLAECSHEVRVVCAPPYYPEWKVAAGYSMWRYARDVMRGVRIWRAPLWVPARPSGLKRMVHLASFALSSLPLLARQIAWRPDAVILIAPTMLCAPGALALARVTRAKAWLHIQDYEVDAAFDLGLLKSGRAARFAYWVERVILKRFDVVSSISSQMVERAVGKGVETEKTEFLPNWVDTRAIFPLERASEYRETLGIPARHTVVLYSGNMGAKQGIETLAAAAAALDARDDISFVFCGSGAARADLVKRCEGLRNCRFLPLQPASSLNELLNVADIHVLPQRSDAADLVMPSKLTGMLASGRAVIAMARPGTALYEAVADNGVIVPPEDTGALVEAIAALAGDGAQRAALGAAGRRYAETMLSPISTLLTLDTRLALLTGEGTPTTAGPPAEAPSVAAPAANGGVMPAPVDESKVGEVQQ